ncbi:restriction endonuclease subunit S, partial [Malacoplasma iowae]
NHYLNSMFSNDGSLPFLRFKEFNVKWKLNKIKDILNYTQPNKYIEDNFDNYCNSESKIPVLTPGKSFILGYTNNIENSFNDESILIDDFTLSMQYTTFPYKVKSSACKILTPKENVNLYFVFNVLMRQNLKPLGHNRHYISFLENKKICLPNIHEQIKISKFLSLLDNNIKLSQENIDNLKIKKLFYINKMFI